MKLKRTISAIAALAMSVSCLAGLTITANAADPVVKYTKGYTGGTDDWAATDMDGTTAGSWVTANTDDWNTVAIDSNAVVVTQCKDNVKNGSDNHAYKNVTLTKDISSLVQAKDIVEIEGVITAPGGADKNRQFIQFGDFAKIVFNTQDGKITPIIDGKTLDDVTPGTNRLRSKEVSFTFKVDTLRKLLTVKAVVNGTTYTFADNKTIDDADISKLSSIVFGASDAKQLNWGTTTKLNKIKISTTDQSALSAVNYSVAYKLADGTVIANDNAGTKLGVTGDNPDTPNMDAFWNADKSKKYFCVSNDLETKGKIAENKEYVVTVREAKEYTRKVVSDGDYKGTVVEEKMYEGETYTNYWPRYYYDEKAGIVYEVAKQSGNPWYGAQDGAATISNPTEDVTTTLSYKKAYENVVYYKDLDGATGNSADIRASNGSAQDNAAFVSDVIPAGTYTVVARSYDRGRASTITLGGETVFELGSLTNGSWGDSTKENVTLEKGGKLELTKGPSNTYALLDTIIVYGEVADTTITSAKAASESLAVDFTAENTDAKKISGEIEAPTFDSLSNNAKYGDKKIISFEVINPDEATVPVISINNKEYPLTSAQWTGITSTTNSTKTYYAEFVKSSNYEWSQYGTVTVAYGDATAAIDLTK